MDAASSRPPGELVVQGGRQNGNRCPLRPTLTLVGRAEGCDVRLAVDDVLPIHCVLVRTPTGLLLRACPGGMVRVNGAPTVDRALADGDVLSVGPFEFVLQLLPVPPVPPSVHEALHVQAAAVAAQQTELADLEDRLRRREQALQRQEAQLAAHLDERRRHLARARRQVREAQAGLRAERARLDAQADDLQRGRAQLAEEQEALRRRRRRLVELRRRARQRQLLQLQQAQQDVAHREAAVAAEQERVTRAAESVAAARRHVNGEVELSRRQIQDGWDRLRRAQEEWEDRRAAEREELRQRAEELAAGREALADETRSWERLRRSLAEEVEGLENRAQNLRARLREGSPGLAPSGPLPSLMTVADGTPRLPAVPDDKSATREELDRLADDLRDQRLHLLEQLQRLGNLQRRWQEEQAAALAEAEAAARRLEERERRLGPREQLLADQEADLQRRRNDLAQRRDGLDAWQARLTVQETSWQTERRVLLAQVEAQMASNERRAQALGRLRERWMRRWRAAAEQLQEERERCAALHRLYATARNQYLDLSDTLERRQRDLAEKSLALEQYQVEIVSRARNSAAAEKALERLRRRAAAATAAAVRRLTAAQEALRAEARRLDGMLSHLLRQSAALGEREQEQEQLGSATEQRQADIAHEEGLRRADREASQARAEALAQQVAALQDEVERLATLLLEAAPLPSDTPLAA